MGAFFFRVVKSVCYSSRVEERALKLVFYEKQMWLWYIGHAARHIAGSCRRERRRGSRECRWSRSNLLSVSSSSAAIEKQQHVGIRISGPSSPQVGNPPIFPYFQRNLQEGGLKSQMQDSALHFCNSWEYHFPKIICDIPISFCRCVISGHQRSRLQYYWKVF